MKTEVPEGMKLTKFAKRILKRLEKRGFAIWEQDDSEFDTIMQLTTIAYQVGYRVIRLDTASVDQIGSYGSKDNNSGAGRFLIIDENAKRARAIEQPHPKEGKLNKREMKDKRKHAVGV